MATQEYIDTIIIILKYGDQSIIKNTTESLNRMKLGIINDMEHRFLDIALAISNLQIYNEYEIRKIEQNEMYHILIDNFKTYKNNNNELFIPKKVRERTKNYLEKSILIMNFFNVNYEITNDNNFFVKIDDIINSYKESDDYKNLNKECKRKLTKEYFINFFKDNVKFNKLFCERKKINGIDYRNILLNYKNIINF